MQQVVRIRTQPSNKICVRTVASNFCRVTPNNHWICYPKSIRKW